MPRKTKCRKVQTKLRASSTEMKASSSEDEYICSQCNTYYSSNAELKSHEKKARGMCASTVPYFGKNAEVHKDSAQSQRQNVQIKRGLAMREGPASDSHGSDSEDAINAIDSAGKESEYIVANSTSSSEDGAEGNIMNINRQQSERHAPRYVTDITIERNELTDLYDWDNDIGFNSDQATNQLEAKEDDDEDSLTNYNSLGYNNDTTAEQPNVGPNKILTEYRRFVKRMQDDTGIERNDRCALRLLGVLDKANVPLYVYDEIIKWATTESTGQCDIAPINFAIAELPGRKTLTSRMITRFDLDDLEPREVPCDLPGSNQTVYITCHDFQASVKALLLDKELMKWENLLFHDPKDPTFFDASVPLVLDDVHTGDVYRQAHVKYCTSKGDVLCPIIIFIDATVVDVHGRNRLEPITFTLAIFNYDTRLLPNAWKTLGYLRDTKNLSGDPLPESMRQEHRFSGDEYTKRDPRYIPIALRDYHAMVYTIVDGLRSSQHNGGIMWEFDYEGLSNTGEVMLKTPVLFIMGDTEGHDKLCGIVGGPAGTKKKNPICRYCRCPREQTENPNVKIVHTRTPELQSLIKEGKHRIVRDSYGYYPMMHNGFDDILFCDAVRGLNGALPPEILHFFQLGYLTYALCGLAEMKRHTAKEGLNVTIVNKNKRRHKSRDYNDGGTYAMRDPKVPTSDIKVFTDQLLRSADLSCTYFGKFLSMESDRDLPRTHFPSGYMPRGIGAGKGGSKTGKKCANELPGVLLCVLLYLVSMDDSAILDNRMGYDGRSHWIKLLDMLLTMERWLKHEGFTRLEVGDAKKCFPSLMQTYKDVVNRTAGNGFGFIKFHLLLHIPEDILRFGNPRNTNSAIGENNHKYNVKNMARRTQRNAITLDAQTARRHYLNTAIRLGFNEINRTYLRTASIGKTNLDSDRMGAVVLVVWELDAQGVVTQIDYQMRNRQNYPKTFGQGWGDLLSLEQFQSWLIEYIIPTIDVSTNYLTMYTELNQGDDKPRYRAHPFWKEKGWNDWCLLSSDDDEEGSMKQTNIGEKVNTTAAAHLLCFLRITGAKENNTEGIYDGDYAYIHRCVRPHLHRNGRESSGEASYYGMENVFYLDPNANFLDWDAKITHEHEEMMERSILSLPPRKMPLETATTPKCFLVRTTQIQKALIGVRNRRGVIPWSYIFVKPRKHWIEIFRDIIKELAS